MSACSHHWVIPSGTGLEAPSVCKKCGETKTFVNSVAVSPWLKSDGSSRNEKAVDDETFVAAFLKGEDEGWTRDMLAEHLDQSKWWVNKRIYALRQAGKIPRRK